MLVPYSRNFDLSLVLLWGFYWLLLVYPGWYHLWKVGRVGILAACSNRQLLHMWNYPSHFHVAIRNKMSMKRNSTRVIHKPNYYYTFCSWPTISIDTVRIRIFHCNEIPDGICWTFFRIFGEDMLKFLKFGVIWEMMYASGRFLVNINNESVTEDVYTVS